MRVNDVVQYAVNGPAWFLRARTHRYKLDILNHSNAATLAGAVL